MYGRVIDASTGAPLWLAHAVIVQPDGTLLQGAVTDPAGWFHLDNPTNRAVLVSHVGYQSAAFIPSGASPYTVLLAPGVDLGEVEIIYDPDGAGVGPGAGPDAGPGAGPGAGPTPVPVGVPWYEHVARWSPWLALAVAAAYARRQSG